MGVWGHSPRQHFCHKIVLTMIRSLLHLHMLLLRGMLYDASVLCCVAQELHVFLEADSPLGSNLQWQQLQPMHGSILEGVARLPKQLFGEPLFRFVKPVPHSLECGTSCDSFTHPGLKSQVEESWSLHTIHPLCACKRCCVGAGPGLHGFPFEMHMGFLYGCTWDFFEVHYAEAQSACTTKVHSLFCCFTVHQECGCRHL